MAKELLVSPSGCVEIQHTVGELINHIQQDENKFFYQTCLRIRIDPEALLKCEKEILELQERIKRLERERDAAIGQIKAITNSNCTFCKWREGTLCTNTEVLEAGECSDRFNK